MITTVDSFKDWLNRNTDEIIGSVVLRSSYRMLPLALKGVGDLNGPPWRGGLLINALFRAIALAHSSQYSPHSDIRDNFVSSLRRFGPDASHAIREYYGAVLAIDLITKASVGLITWAAAFLQLNSAAEKIEGVSHDFWLGIDADIEWLNDCDLEASEHQPLMALPLWSNGKPTWFDREWKLMSSHLLQRDEGFEIWTNWFERRIKGAGLGFGPSKITDQSIMLHLAGQNRQFWEQESSRINQSMKQWIENAPRPSATTQVLSSAQILTQNQDAIVWKYDNEEAKFTTDDYAGVHRLKCDADAVDRYREAISLAEALVVKADEHGNTSGNISQIVRQYIESMGENIENCRPSILVSRGERIRQKLESVTKFSDDSLYPPISEDVVEAMRAWLSAHNQFVGMDASLEQRDRAMYGPDSKKSVVGRDDLKGAAGEMKARGIISDEGYVNIVTAANNAPSTTNSLDRRLIFSSESAKNLIIDIIQTLSQPKNISIVVASAAAGSLVSFPVLAGTTGSVIVVAKYVKDFQHILRRWLSDSPNALKVLNAYIEIVEDSKK